MKAIKAYIFFSLVLSCVALFAQTQVEVITKTVDKTIVLKSGYDISLQGQGAKIMVGESSTKDIQLSLKLISKGLTKQIAERELGYQKYVIDELNKTVVIRNYLLLPNNVELSTIQETIIDLRIPKGANLSISNSFGSIEIEGLGGKMNVESEYGDISVKDFNGECVVKGNYGDFKGSNFHGRLLVDTDHTEIKLISFSGMLRINSNLGNISIKDLNSEEASEIRGEKSDITIHTTNLSNYSWDIRSKYGTMNIPEVILDADSDDNQKRVLTGSAGQIKIQLTTDFGDITIKEQ